MEGEDLTSLLESMELSSDAITCIGEEGFNTVKDLSYLQEEDIKSFKINIRDRCRLRAAVDTVWRASQGIQYDILQRPGIGQQKRRQVVSEYSPVTTSHSIWEGVEPHHRQGADQLVAIPVVVKPKDFETLVSESKLVEDGDLPHYQLSLKDVGELKEPKLRKVEYGKPSTFSNSKSILVIGETGSGKSTMVNGFVNHILGVTSEDKIRFNIIDPRGEESTQKGVEQSASQTDWITCYTVHKILGGNVPFTLNIVDTPGFADTRGLEMDKKIVEQIKQLFISKDSHGLSRLDAICFVVKSSSTRLTVNQRYVFDAIMSVFGKDLKENICIFCSFSDGPNPEVLRCIKKETYTKYFAFNNAWLIQSCNPLLRQQHFQLNQRSFHEFIEYLDTISPKSLQMSIDVLEERDRLTEAVDRLQDHICMMFGHVSNVDQVANLLEEKEKRHTGVEVKTVEPTKKMSAKRNMNCSVCKYTCRRGCDRFQRFISTKFKKNTLCRVCDCLINKHTFEKIEMIYSHVTSYVTLVELQEKYGNLDDTKALKALQKEKDKWELKINKALQRMKSSIDKLNEIALQAVKMSTAEYIDLIILREEVNKSDNFQDRISLMHKLKDQCKLITNLSPDAEYM